MSGAGSEEGVERKHDRTHEDPAHEDGKGAPSGSLRYFYGDSGGFAHVQVTGGGGRGASLLCLCCTLSWSPRSSCALQVSCDFVFIALGGRAGFAPWTTFGKLTRSTLSWLARRRQLLGLPRRHYTTTAHLA